jgi:hypothetical protein
MTKKFNALTFENEQLNQQISLLTSKADNLSSSAQEQIKQLK